MQQPDAGTAAETAAHEKEGATAAEAAVKPAIGSTSVGEVEQELDAALAKASENYELYLRAKADAENIRRRGQEEVTKAYKFAVESFAESLVPVVDSLEKALEVKDASAEQLREGVELTLRQLRSAFEKNALAEINPVGQRFDPHRHQAISSVPASAQQPANQVVTVLQKGWTISERVLRPALVVIAK
jgi:molecular chaperone GrpE